MPTNWRVYKKETVASRLDRSELTGFFRKKVVVGPNEAAIVVRDGMVFELLTENSAEVAGALDQAASLFGAGADLAVFFIELAPFDLTIHLGASQTTAAAGTVRTVAGNTESVAASGEIKRTSSRWDRFKQAARSALGIASASDGIGWRVDAEAAVEASSAVTMQKDVSQICIAALSADGEVVQALCQLRLQIDTNCPESLLGLLKGKKALATWDVAALLRDEWFAKVIVPELAKHQSSELRGDRELLGELESQTRDALATTLETCGLLLQGFSISWGLTEQEQADLDRRRGEREEVALEFAKTRAVAQMTREQAIGRSRIENLQELKRLEETGQLELDLDLKKMVLAGAMDRALLEKGQEVDVATIDAQIRDITLEVEHKESMARLAKRKAEEDLRLELEDREYKEKHSREHHARLDSIDAEDKKLRNMVDLQIRMATEKHDRVMSTRRHESDVEYRKLQAEIDDRYQQRKIKLDESLHRMGMMERLLGQGLQAGQTDASVLKTMLEQSTEQEYATTSDEKVRARSDAQGAGNNLETFRQAQADERAHQIDMTRLSAQMMDASKQGPAPIFLPGVGQSRPSAGAPIFINNPGPDGWSAGIRAGTVPPSSPGSTPTCTQCRQEVQPGWKACPACGTPTGAKCSGCGGDVQRGWIACPRCGQALAVAKPSCTRCGSEVQASWKACPACGNPL